MPETISTKYDNLMKPAGRQHIAVFSPAKINLCLAVTGRREDGRHNLVSLVAPVRFGDTLWVTPQEGEARDRLECAHPDVPLDEENLVLRAAKAFRQLRPFHFGLHFHLHKRIPAGAGLGGGSSNAAAALKAMNHLSEPPLETGELRALAARLGSDCPLFLHSGPVIIRGAGEEVTPVDDAAATMLSGKSVIIFKPEFAVETAWAYGQLAARQAYLDPAEAERRLDECLREKAWAGQPGYNSFAPLLLEKFLSLAVLQERLREEFNLECRLSGSGSACFIPAGKEERKKLRNFILDMLGPDTFYVETLLV